MSHSRMPYSFGIFNTELALCIKRAQCLFIRTKHLITREGFTLIYIINGLCVINGFYRTSIVTKQKNLVFYLVLSYQNHLKSLSPIYFVKIRPSNFLCNEFLIKMYRLLQFYTSFKDNE